LRVPGKARREIAAIAAGRLDRLLLSNVHMIDTNTGLGAINSSRELQELLITVRARVRKYLVSRQSTNGGFCFYRSAYADHPNLADTASAVRSFRLLDIPVPCAAKVGSFVAALALQPQPEYLFNLVTVQRAIGCDDIAIPVSKMIHGLSLSPAPGPEYQQTGWFERTRFLAHLKRVVGDLRSVACIAAHIGEMLLADGFGRTPNLWDTWLAIDTLLVCGDVSIPETIREFVDRLQCRPSGFTLCIDSQVLNLNTVFAGVQCCDLLHIPLKYRREILRFVLACQAGHGGFAASPGAVPNLELTERAIRVLVRLWPETASDEAG